MLECTKAVDKYLAVLVIAYYWWSGDQRFWYPMFTPWVIVLHCWDIIMLIFVGHLH